MYMYVCKCMYIYICMYLSIYTLFLQTVSFYLLQEFNMMMIIIIIIIIINVKHLAQTVTAVYKAQ